MTTTPDEPGLQHNTERSGSGSGAEAAGDRPDEQRISDLRGIVSRLHKAAGHAEQVALGDLVDAMGHSSIAAVLLVPALLLVSPLSGVPGASVVGGIVIALISAQILLRRPTVWLPGFIRTRKLPGPALRRALVWLRKPAGKFDGLAPARPEGGDHSWWTPALALVCLCLGLAMPLMELIPFSSSIAASLIAALAMTMLTGRIRIAIVAVILAGAAVGAVAGLM